MFTSLSVVDVAKVLASYAKPVADNELTSYEVDGLLKRIEESNASHIIAFDENSDEKVVVGLDTLSVMLKDRNRYYRHNVETLTVMEKGIVLDRYIKQLDGHWLNIRRVFSKFTSVDYAALQDVAYPSTVFEMLRDMGVIVSVNKDPLFSVAC